MRRPSTGPSHASLASRASTALSESCLRLPLARLLALLLHEEGGESAPVGEWKDGHRCPHKVGAEGRVETPFETRY